LPTRTQRKNKKPSSKKNARIFQFRYFFFAIFRNCVPFFFGLYFLHSRLESFPVFSIAKIRMNEREHEDSAPSVFTTILVAFFSTICLSLFLSFLSVFISFPFSVLFSLE